MELSGRRADGRVLRGTRNRAAIVDALFALVGRGQLEPTAQQVAAAAGVGIRSVFRHFTEMDGLHRAMDARLAADAAHLLATPRTTGSFDVRLRALVRQRAALFEHVAPYKRAANLQRWRSAFLQGRHRRLQRLLRDELHAWLPEVARAPAPIVEAIDVIASLEAWERLRRDRGLDVAAASAVVTRAVRALLGPRAGAARRRRSRSPRYG